MKDLSDIVCAIAGPGTMRSLENLRRTLEDLWVKSTAQGASAEEQAAFNPTMIAQAHEAARRDNAKMIVSWAKAIYDELTAPDQLADLKNRLLYAKDKVRFFNRELAVIDEGRAFATLPAEERERQAEATERALRQAQEEILRIEKDLRDLQQPAPPVPGHPSSAGHPGSQFPGHDNLDGVLPPVP
jgi:hypothetical protein